jgi:hypothetical protein
VFSSEGGKLMSEQLGLFFVGKIPIDPDLMKCEETGQNFIQQHPNSQTLHALFEFVKRLTKTNV